MDVLTVDTYPPLFWDATNDAIELLGRLRAVCVDKDVHGIGCGILRRAQDRLADEYRAWVTGHE